MPASPSAAQATRRIDALNKNGQLNIGKQTGPYDTDAVRRRVRNWQADGAAVVAPTVDNNVVVVEYENESDSAEAPKHKDAQDKTRTHTDSTRKPRQTSPKKSPKSPRNMDSDLQAWVRRKSTPRNELDTDVKLAAAPLKRVVSDAHWRKDREPAKCESREESKPYTIKRTSVYTRNSPPQSPKKDDGIRVAPIARTTYDDGIRVTPIEESLDEKHKRPTSKSDDDKRPRSSDDPRQRRPGFDSTNEDATRRDRRRRGEREVSRNDSDRRRRLRRSYASPAASEAGTEVRSVAQTLDPDDSISTRNGRTRKLPDLVFKDDEDVTKERGLKTRIPDQPLPKPADLRTSNSAQPVYGNRIEAWLTNTPGTSGTSVTDENVSEYNQDENLPPAQKRGERPRSAEESFQQKERRRGARSSEEDIDVKEGGHDTRSANKYRGSRTTKTASESLPSLYEEEASSCATSSVAPSDVEIPDVKLSKHSPGANLRRRFPTTGKRLSTIASADTLHEPATPSEISEQDTVVPERNKSSSSVNGGLKRRLTRHEDLISVLSLPRGDARSIVSARSIRTNRVRLERATLQDLWEEFTADESKYQRELRTLVDGVIPVLLSCVLSKSDSAVAAGLFGRSGAGDLTITKPIVDMGVALERLKAHHRRAPASNEVTLISWAQGAVRIYSDYLKAWRMGFQDVVVNLAPAEATSGKEPDWDDGLARNKDGDLVNGDGERVDVAFLLKRPLVRLKYLAKTFKGINFLAPNATASSIADKYQDLVTEARRRSNEERARLEDEAAAGIDATRARDPQSLALITGVSIDPNRCVRARDYFDMNMIHSSGQQLDCRVELVYRDDAPGRGNSGDVLVCEVSDTGRWLLFPPVRKEYVSSRPGQGPGDLVIMIRGQNSASKEWQELLALHANDEDTSPEWIEMLGSNPVPPSLARKSSFLTQSHRPRSAHTQGDVPLTRTIPMKRASEVDIPIGEGPVTTTIPLRSDRNPTEKLPSHVERERPSSSSSSSSRLEREPVPTVTQDARKVYSLPNSPLKQSTSAPWSEEPGSPGLKRSKATRHRSSQSVSTSPSLPSLRSPVEQQTPDLRDRPTHAFSRSETATSLSSYSSQSTLSQMKSDYSVWMPSSVLTYDDDSEEDEDNDTSDMGPSEHSRYYGDKNPVSAPARHHSSQPDLLQDSPKQPDRSNQVRFEEQRQPQPAKLQKRRKSGPQSDHEDEQPRSPKNVSPPSKLKLFSIPSLTPAFLKRHRRSSSPLKHEYEPSVNTESSTDSELSYSDTEDESITSESSDEDAEILPEIKSPGIDPVSGFGKATPPGSLPSLPEATLSPSQSASQAPYRTVPQQAHNASKTVASIFSWSDRGTWEALHPHECVIIVTPGLVEAFDMSDAVPAGSEGSNVTSPSAKGVQPLVAFEVTPLVPLRRGTALDISIRSPPTTNSKMRASNNVMFRSRNAEECELLYSLINTARINNPTYIALQNARGPLNESTWAAAMDQQNEKRSSTGSWFHNPLRRSNTYRSKASRPASQITDSSVGTMNSAFSALRRFNGNSRIFNIAKSTITSRQGSRSGTSDSLSSGASSPIAYDPLQGTPLGITNAKIRLYFRESQNKWRDMGSARLSILLPPRPTPGTPVNPRTVGMEKRIVVAGKTRGETLLDVTLGESCFERVARTGIAVSVWEDKNGPAAIGGVLASKAKTYMVQHKTERECAYTFGLVGKLRY